MENHNKTSIIRRLISSLQTKVIFKVIAVLLACVFPILCMLYLGDGKIIAFYYVWVAFYSSLFVCLVFQNKVVKIFFCSLNGVFVVGLTLLFLMGGTGIIPGVIWNAIVPFLKNPWY